MKKSTKNILIGLGSIIVIFTVSYFKTRKMQSLHTENKDEDDE
jgi:CHASE3 domain sensor protein